MRVTDKPADEYELSLIHICFSEEKIQELLELSKQLVDNNPSEDMEHTWSENFRGLMTSGNTISAFSGIGMLELYEQTDIAGVDEIYGLSRIAIVCDILEKQQGLSVVCLLYKSPFMFQAYLERLRKADL